MKRLRLILMLVLSIGASMAIADSSKAGVYNSQTGLLAIPSVRVHRSKETYNVELKERIQGREYTFDLYSATLSPPNGQGVAVYNSQTGLLAIPSVSIDESKDTYSVKLQNRAVSLEAPVDNTGLVSTSEEVGYREDGSGAFRTHCLEAFTSYDDPLVHPGKPGAAHHHVFFGNPDVNAYTTAEDLKMADETTCDGDTLNRSAYWVPALYDANGDRIEYVEPLFYYKTGYHIAANTIRPAPAGLRMIAGNAHAVDPQGTQVIKVRCDSWQPDRVWFSAGDPLDHVDYFPDCPMNDLLEVRIVFPQCWDGENLSAPDNKSHMAYPYEAVPPITGTGGCPESHPIAIPEISYNFRMYVTEETGPSSAWRVASDGPNVALGGITLHADWMNGWDAITMDKIVANCLRPAKECMVGLLGDGTQLKPIIPN